MLPETSSMTMSRIGCGVLSNSVIGCGLPSSRTSKSSRVERRDEPAVPIGHGDEDADGVAAGPEDRLLTRGDRCAISAATSATPGDIRFMPCLPFESEAVRAGIIGQEYQLRTSNVLREGRGSIKDSRSPRSNRRSTRSRQTKHSK